MNVVYGDRMVADLPGHVSPSSSKPRLLVEHLRERGYPMELHEPPALTREQLALAHDRAYVDAVLDGRAENGFGSRDPQVAASLPYTSGSLYLAAQLALVHGVAASFSSGFHHAGYDHGGGFCTFNGLAVTACLLPDTRILILDLDHHYGNGTDHILRRLPNRNVQHETFGARFHSPSHARHYLEALERLTGRMEADLILYQAGADVHVDDPLGGLLTTEQMAERDRLVFRSARQKGIPVAWNLAGGYQRDREGTILPVLRLHEQTYRIALDISSSPCSRLTSPS